MQENTRTSASTIWQKAFVEPTQSGFWQLVRFGLTGGLATVVDYAVMLCLYSYLHVTEWVAVAAGYCCGNIICYILSVMWIFPSRSVSNRKLEFTVFMIIGVMGLALTELIVQIGLHIVRSERTAIAGFSPKMQLVAVKSIAIVIVFFFNFVARKTVLFRAPKNA